MNKPAKLIALAVLVLVGLFVLMNRVGLSGTGSNLLAKFSFEPLASPMPPANTVANTGSDVDSPTPSPTPAAADSTFPKTFTLGKDSQSEYGEVEFDHESHAFANRSPDGKSVMGCVECHHTEQPKSALKPPLVTSERDATLTFDLWKTSTQKVSECRACHFQEGNVPTGKKMPTATFEQGGKSKIREVTNMLAFHTNCNICHNDAAKARPELKAKPGFPTKNDCAKCHKSS